MSENEKLVERLREGADWPEVRPISASELREAATALTLAQARIRELETALEPFSHLDYTYQRVSRDGWTAILSDEAKRANHLLRARQTLKEASE